MINKILKKRRKELGFTQRELAEKAGVSLRTYQAFESGSRDITHARLDIARKIFIALELKY